MVYWVVTVIIACTVAIVVTICILVSWLVIFHKHSKYNRLKKKMMESQSSIVECSVPTVNFDKVRHAPIYNEKSFAKDGKDINNLIYSKNAVQSQESSSNA